MLQAVPFSHILTKAPNGTINAQWTCQNNGGSDGIAQISLLNPSVAREAFLFPTTGVIPPGGQATAGITFEAGSSFFPSPVNSVVLRFNEVLADGSLVRTFAEHPFTVSMAVPQEVILAFGENLIHGFTYARDTLWATTATTPGKLLRFNSPLVNLNDYTVLTFPSDGNHNNPAEIIYNPALDGLHILFSDAPGGIHIATIDPDTLASMAEFHIAGFNAPAFSGLTLAMDHLFVLTKTAPSQLLKINPATGAVVSVGTLANMQNGHALTNDGAFIYGVGQSMVEPLALIFRANPDNLGDALFQEQVLGEAVLIADDLAVVGGTLWLPIEFTPPGLPTGQLTGVHLSPSGFSPSRTAAFTGRSLGSFGVGSDGARIWSTWQGAPGEIIAHHPVLGDQPLYRAQFPLGFESTNELAFTPAGDTIFVSFWAIPARVARLPNPLFP